MFALLDEMPEIKDKPCQVLAGAAREIRFENVRFAL